MENSDDDFRGVNYWKGKKPKQLRKSVKAAVGERSRDLKQLNLSLVMLLGGSFLLLKGENRKLSLAVFLIACCFSISVLSG